MQRHTKVGLTLLIVGAIPLLYTTFRTYSHNWAPLSVSVDLKPAEFQSPEFKTDITGRHVVSLAFDNALPAEKEDCMMGMDFPKGRCGRDARTLFLEWSVVGGPSSSSPAQYKPHAFSGSPGRMETELGEFEASRGEPQKIVLNILTNAGEMNAAHPTLIVKAHRMYWEKWIILGQLTFLFAIVLGTTGIGSIILPSLFRRRKAQSMTT